MADAPLHLGIRISLRRRHRAPRAVPRRTGLASIIGHAFSARAAHRRLVDHVILQVALGRALGAVLDDPYVVNRTLRIDRLSLVEHPGWAGRYRPWRTPGSQRSHSIGGHSSSPRAGSVATSDA
jgi:hypothetical protein